MYKFICLLVCVTYVSAQRGGNEYLPPAKGYNYDVPKVPFPSTPNEVTYRPPQPPRPQPPPQRPVTLQPPTYIPPGPTRQPPQPTYRPQPTQPPTHDDHDHHHHHEPGMPFDFNYAVNDVETANDYSHKAVSDGDVTRGEYRIQLPDGRTQIVRYTADWKNGYNAEVSYEGTAQYPEGPFPQGGSQGYKY